MLYDSRLRNGTLTLGTTPQTLDVSCQITNCRITTSYDDDGDSVTTLCGDTTPAPRINTGHTIAGTIIQDFDRPVTSGGVIAWLWAHELEIVAYSFKPDNLGSPTITGTLQVEIPGDTFGGDVNTRITTDFEWRLQQRPTFMWPTTTEGEAPADTTVAA